MSRRQGCRRSNERDSHDAGAFHFRNGAHMHINPTESAVSNLLALIVASNPRFSVMAEDALQVESVTALATPDADGNDTVTVVSAQGYSHTAAFSYRRLPLTEIVPADVPP